MSEPYNETMRKIQEKKKALKKLTSNSDELDDQISLLLSGGGEV